MTTKTTNNPEDRVEALEEQISDLRHQRRQALQRAQEAEQRLEKLDGPRVELAPAAFRGDETAARNLEVIENEAQELVRTIQLGRSAASEFERMVEEAKEKLSEARREIVRQRYIALCREDDELRQKCDELAAELTALLEKRASLRWKMVEAVRAYDPDEANNLAAQRRGPTKRWIEGKFGRWLQ